MTYFTRALEVPSYNYERSLAVSQVFSSDYKKVVAGLRLKNDISINLALNSESGTFSYAVQTLDSNNDSIDLDTYGKQFKI